MMYGMHTLHTIHLQHTLVKRFAGVTHFRRALTEN
jgi:hypothetical protein